MKTCTKCGKEQPMTEFYKDSKKKDGLTSHCKTCQIARYKDNDKHKARQLEYRKARWVEDSEYRECMKDKNKVFSIADNLANPAKRKNKHLKKYGITIEDYHEMFKKQEGRCRICKKHQSEEKVALSVDHCHTTGKVRGLLCMGCNTAIGSFKDNLELLTAAIEYLKEL